MVDIQGWFWFGIRLFIYSTILFFICIGFISAFAIWYYLFVVRRRSQEKPEITTKLPNRSFVFHTLSFQISNSGIIVLSIQLSPLEKHPIELAQLNGRQYKITSFDIQEEQVEIIFAQSNIHLT